MSVFSLCGPNIGQLKHEGIFYHVKFFAPKVYARYDGNGKLLPELSRFKGVDPKYRKLLFKNITPEGVNIEYEKTINQNFKQLTHTIEKIKKKYTLDRKEHTYEL